MQPIYTEIRRRKLRRSLIQRLSTPLLQPFLIALITLSLIPLLSVLLILRVVDQSFNRIADHYLNQTKLILFLNQNAPVHAIIESVKTYSPKSIRYDDPQVGLNRLQQVLPESIKKQFDHDLLPGVIEIVPNYSSVNSMLFHLKHNFPDALWTVYYDQSRIQTLQTQLPFYRRLLQSSLTIWLVACFIISMFLLAHLKISNRIAGCCVGILLGAFAGWLAMFTMYPILDAHPIWSIDLSHDQGFLPLTTLLGGFSALGVVCLSKCKNRKSPIN
jgi:hypothetical protein